MEGYQLFMRHPVAQRNDDDLFSQGAPWRAANRCLPSDRNLRLFNLFVGFKVGLRLSIIGPRISSTNPDFLLTESSRFRVQKHCYLKFGSITARTETRLAIAVESDLAKWRSCSDVALRVFRIDPAECRYRDTTRNLLAL